MKWRLGEGEQAVANVRATLAAYPNDTDAAIALFGCRKAACAYCGEGFLTGPRTGRRLTAQYCSDLHRVYAARKRDADATP